MRHDLIASFFAWHVLSACLVLAGVGCAPAPLPRNIGEVGQQPPFVAGADAATGGPESPVDEQEPVDYMPLSLESRWEYDVALELPLAEPRQAAAVTRVDGRKTIGDKSYYKVVMQVSGAPYNPTTVAYYRKTEAGLFQIFEGEEDQGEWLYLPARLEIGQQWKATTKSKECQFEVVGREDVTCADTDYHDCIHLTLAIKGTFGTNRQEQWLAPGIGIVKQSDENLLFKQKSTLTRFQR